VFHFRLGYLTLAIVDELLFACFCFFVRLREARVLRCAEIVGASEKERGKEDRAIPEGD